MEIWQEELQNKHCHLWKERMSEKFHRLRSGKDLAQEITDTNPAFQNLPLSKTGKKKINFNSHKIEFG